MKTVAEVIGVSRSNLIERMRERPKKRIGRPPLPDDKLVAEIKAVIAELPTYGYRRVHAILKRQALGRAPRLRRKGNFDFAATRRREIVAHARYVGAAATEDFSRWLIAWVWHNPNAQDQIWSLQNVARQMGRSLTEEEAEEIIEEASITPRQLSADNLAKFLGVIYEPRQRIGITTIGSVNVKKRARRELRKLQDFRAKERLRRARGMRPQSQSLSATQPWRELNMSRAKWYRLGKPKTGPNETNETGSSEPVPEFCTRR